MTTDLDKLSQAERMLAEVATVNDATAVIDFAEAARVFAKQAKLGTSAVNHATTVKLRAERRLADMVDEGQRRGEIADQGQPKKPSPSGDYSPPPLADAKKPPPSGGYSPPTLSALGVDHRRLAEARVIRDTFSEEDLLARAALADEKDRELSRKELVKHAVREKRIREKRERVEQIREAEPAPLETLAAFPVLYADPPWRYEHSETTTREIENHYPTMALGEIKKLEVPAAEDAVLFLWVTSPKLLEAVDLLEAWDFEYRTSMVWVKDRMGMGYYARQQHELLLVAKRGALPVPDPEDRPPSVIQAARGLHSAKPDLVYELIERMYPLREKCEMFQRRPRPGWYGWGNQAGEAA